MPSRTNGRLSRAALALFSALIAACGSTPEVDRNEMLTNTDTKRNEGTAFVSPAARDRVYRLVAVAPFRAPVELAGASISDLFANEILKTYKYRLVERGQMEQVLGEQALGLKGVTDNALAMKLGKMLGVQGVIVGTVPEYGSKASGASELSAVGINVRMIDVSDGSIVWSISDSAISDKPVSLSSFARRMVEAMVANLVKEWIRAGDLRAANIAEPQLISSEGRIRGAVIEARAEAAATGIVVERARSEQGPYQEVFRGEGGGKTIRFEDSKLLDAETYHYRITALAKSGFISTPAGPFSVTTVGPPPPVTGVRASSGLIRKSEISWDPSTDPNVAGYLVSRRGASGGWNTLRDVSGRSSSQMTDDDLKDAQTCAYRVIAYNTARLESPPSTAAEATTKGPPAAVNALRANSGEPRRVSLYWEPVLEPEVKGYAVFSSQKEGGPFQKIAFIPRRESTTWLDAGKKSFSSDVEDAPSPAAGTGSLGDETRYFYHVRAVNVVDVQSADSPTASAVTKPVPAPVRGVRALGNEPRRASLSWQTSPETDIVRYEIFRGDRAGDNGKQVLKVEAGAAAAVDGDLKPGTTYVYRVRAVDRDGLVGKFSEPREVATKPLPARPQGVQAVFGSGVGVSWQKNAEPDIVRYLVQKKAFFGWDAAGESTGTSFVYNGEAKPGKTLTFRVVAVDADGQQGEPSADASVAIP